MRFNILKLTSLIPLAAMLTLANGSLLFDSADALSARQGCSITFCGESDPGVNCCSGLFCSSINRCTSCGISGGFCGAAGDNVPCCAGLFCSSTERCSPCIGTGGLCQVDVPCCSGLCPNGQTCEA